MMKKVNTAGHLTLLGMPLFIRMTHGVHQRMMVELRLSDLSQLTSIKYLNNSLDFVFISYIPFLLPSTSINVGLCVRNGKVPLSPFVLQRRIITRRMHKHVTKRQHILDSMLAIICGCLFDSLVAKLRATDASCLGSVQNHARRLYRKTQDALVLPFVPMGHLR